MSDPKPVQIDLDYNSWKLPEVRAFRAATQGKLPDRAMIDINNAMRRVKIEAAEVCEGMTQPDEWQPSDEQPEWEPEPPDDWIPQSLGEIDPDVLAAFCWIPARREQPDLSYDDFCETLPYGELQQAFWKMLFDSVDEVAEPPFPTPETTSPSAPPSGDGHSSTSGASTGATSKRRAPTPRPSRKRATSV